jgi:protein O-GlcNAc transferase
MLTTKNRVGSGVLLVAALVGGLTGCTPSGPRALLEGKRLLEAGDTTNALAKLRVATSLLSTNAQAWNYLGVACHRAGLLTNAASAYHRAIGLDRDLFEARFNLGCLMLEQNELDAAKVNLTSCALRRPSTPEVWLKLGVTQLRLRESTGAERSYREALRLSPRNAEALNGLGLVQLQRSRPQEAQQFFSAALQAQHDYRPALLNSAVPAHSHTRNRPLALQRYREYLALTPRPPDWEAVNAVALALEQQLNRAAVPTTNVVARPVPAVVAKPTTNAPPRSVAVAKTEATTNILRLAPAAPPSGVATQVVRAAPPPELKPAPTAPPATGPVSKATDPLPTVSSMTPGADAAGLAEAPPRKRSLLQRVNPLNLFRRQPKAPPRPTPLAPTPGQAVGEAATRVTARPADQSEGAAGGTSSATAATRPPEIPRYPDRALAKPAPGNRDAAERAFTQGAQAQRAGRLAETMQAYRTATELDPAYFEAHYNLGVAASHAGNLAQALAAYEWALAVQPDSVDARYNFALALKQSGYLLDAATELERIVASDPNEARARLALGNLYAQQLRQPAKAREHYVKVLEIEPRHSEGTAIRYWLLENPR